MKNEASNEAAHAPKDPTYEVFGKTVRQLREAIGLSQTELAKRLSRFGVEMRPNTVTKLEQALRPTTIKEFGAIANSLDISPLELFTLTFPPEGSESASIEDLRNTRDELQKYGSQIQQQLAMKETEVATLRATLAENSAKLRQVNDYLHRLEAGSNGDD